MGSVIKMEVVLLDRQCRARRKSRTSLKIFKETHRIVPEPRTKRQDGGEEKRKREREEKRCYRRQDKDTSRNAHSKADFHLFMPFPLFEAMRAQSPLSFSCPV